MYVNNVYVVQTGIKKGLLVSVGGLTNLDCVLTRAYANNVYINSLNAHHSVLLRIFQQWAGHETLSTFVFADSYQLVEVQEALEVNKVLRHRAYHPFKLSSGMDRPVERESYYIHT